MDTSKEYIKMCEKWHEGRALWKPKSGDFVYSKENKKIVVLYFNEHHGNPPWKYLDKNFAIPLYRQDQLQDMIVGSLAINVVPIATTKRFLDFITLYGDSFRSMEQRWLAFVMSEKFGKVWIENGWQKKNKN